MRKINASDEVKGYIGYRIVILFVFFFVAILAGLVYFDLLPKNLSKFNVFKNSKSPTDSVKSDFEKAFESTPSETRETVVDNSLLQAAVVKDNEIKAKVTAVDKDLGKVFLSSGDKVYVVTVASLKDFEYALTHPDTASADVVVLSKKVGMLNEIQPEYSVRFMSDTPELLNKDVLVGYNYQYSPELDKVGRMLTIYYE